MKSVCHLIFYYVRIKTRKAAGVERGTHRPPIDYTSLNLRTRTISFVSSQRFAETFICNRDLVTLCLEHIVAAGIVV